MATENTGRRSPNYPGIDLFKAIERARVLYEKARQATVGYKVILEYWGYNNPRGGAAAVQFAALQKFGLLEVSGNGEQRQGKLTQLALRILHEHDERMRLLAIREAALLPRIHQEVWAYYNGHLPDTRAVRSYLMLNKGFVEPGVDEFVKQFKATVAFAKLEDHGNISPPDEAKEPDETEKETMPATAPAPNREPQPPSELNIFGKEFRLVMSPDGLARAEEGFVLDKAKWLKLKKLLEVYEPDA